MNSIPSQLIFFLLFSATTSFGQSSQVSDSVEVRLWADDCENRVFTKVEILPTIKGGNKKFEDSLTSYINAVNDLKDSAYLKLRFVISANSNILSFERKSNSFQKPELIEEFIKSHPKFWNPATQNGRQVCAYMYLEIIIANKKVVSKISQ